MKCPRCKKQLRKGAKFCPACGARVEKKRGIRFTSILLVIVLLLSIVAIGWSGGILFAKYFSGNFKDLFSGKKNVEIHNVEEAITHAREFGEVYGYENAMSELTEKVTTTIDGDSYYRLQQNYQGIPVYGRNLVYTIDKTGTVMSITGNIHDVNEEIILTPSIDREKAIGSIATYAKTILGYDQNVTIQLNELNNEDLCIYSGDLSFSNLAYSLYALLQDNIMGGYYEIVLNANTGEIYVVNNLINSATPEIGTLSGLNQDHDNVSYLSENEQYILADMERNIVSYYADNYTTTYNFQNIEVWDNTGTPVIWNATTAPSSEAVDAYVNTQITYDYFKRLGCTSTDGNGDATIALCTGVQYTESEDDANEYERWVNNSYSLSSNKADKIRTDLVFGISNGEHPPTASMLDVVAHEYMHGVDFFHSNIRSGGEPGAIKEALSDIMGELVEADHLNAEPNWYNSFRDHINPAMLCAPSHYLDDPYWQDTSNLKNDDGGVHKNSTVISRAAFLMWYGINENEEKRISSDDLATLWYRAMLMMPSDCDFNECRELVELAATTMTLTTAQRTCVAEAFDNVGITGTSQSNDSKLILFTASGETAVKGTVYEVKSENGIERIVPVSEATMTVYSGNSTKSYKKMNMKKENGFFEIELPAGTYSVAITADGYIGQTISFELADNEVRYFSVELESSDNKTGNNTDAYSAYRNATQKTMVSGSWSEHLVMTANMAITDGSAKTKTKVTLTSDADVSNYSENNPSQIRMSGSAEMTVMGQTYAWDMEYENGTAHYRYTKPNQTSADMKIDPSFFNFGTMTSDMMTNAKLSGNKITFTVPGDKIAKVGIAAVNQMSGVDNLEYGDVDVTVTISNEGKIDNIVMVFHASLEYQGYDADVDYNIDYRFADSAEKSDKPASGGMGNLHEYLDFTKSWGIRKDVASDPQLPMEQVFDFAFMEDGTFYCYFYQQYTDFMDGFYGTYLFEDDQIKFYFDNDDGTSTLYAYSFDTDAMKLTQVSEKGIWSTSVGTVYSLENDEWFPSAKDVIDSAKRAIDNKGMELGG